MLEEIALVADLNVRIFVLDDGWQQDFGEWQAHKTQFATGLKPVADALTAHGMTFGIWMAPLYVDSTTAYFAQHPKLRITDDQQRPVVGRWQKHAFCLASDYYPYFIQTCKKLIDQWVRFFKWDGLDKHLCASPHHNHGNDQNSPLERQQRYGFFFPLETV